jgi:hypothetical protein
MVSVIVSLWPFIVGSLLAPFQITLALLLLQSPEQGLRKAAFYLGGMTVVRAVPILVFGPILVGNLTIAAQARGDGRGPVVSAFLLVLGILLLITAYKKWNVERDPDEPPRKWLQRFDNLTPLKAFAIGFGMMLISTKFWVFSLGALTTIGEARLGQPFSILAYLLFALLAESLLLIPILIRVVLPGKSDSVLAAMSTWLNSYEDLIVAAGSFLFGLILLYLGVRGLLA